MTSEASGRSISLPVALSQRRTVRFFFSHEGAVLWVISTATHGALHCFEHVMLLRESGVHVLPLVQDGAEHTP